MNYVIWKWAIPLGMTARHNIPDGARIAMVGAQGSDVCVWMMCDPNEPTIERKFRVVATGHPLADAFGDTTDSYSFVGSCQMGMLVWHLFEIGRIPQWI